VNQRQDRNACRLSRKAMKSRRYSRQAARNSSWSAAEVAASDSVRRSSRKAGDSDARSSAALPAACRSRPARRRSSKILSA
jgi:hypothetical protein